MEKVPDKESSKQLELVSANLNKACLCMHRLLIRSLVLPSTRFTAEQHDGLRIIVSAQDVFVQVMRPTVIGPRLDIMLRYLPMLAI